jgi:NTE family protein
LSDEPRTVSLVLGSGGARGHAHIGVIHAIEERGLDIRTIAGTSMGAVIGGVYAANELDTYTRWAENLTQRDVMRLLDFSFTWTSIFKGDRVFGVLKELIGDRQIEELDPGFTAVATAIGDQREIWLNKGSLFTAIRASTAVPGVFSPVELDDRILVDGGLVNPVPIAPTLNDSTDITVAVSLSGVGDRHWQEQQPLTTPSPEDNGNGYREKISRFLDNLVDSDEEEEKTPPDLAELLTSSIDIMQGAIARLKLAAYSPDITVEIPRETASFFEFHRARELSDLGYETTVKVLDDFLG